MEAEEARERRDEERGGEEKERRSRVSVETGAGTSKVEVTRMQVFNTLLHSYL